MSWLNNFVRPRIQAIVSRRNVPENLWDKCPSCEQMIFHREIAEHLFVCPNCDCHMAISPARRFRTLFDKDGFETVELPEAAVDPLKFRDSKRYADRLRDARAKTGAADAVVVAHGRIGGRDAVACGFDFSFMGGSMGVAVGEAVVSAARLAVLQQAPLIVFPASGGARMQEGILSLMQMPRTTIAIDEVREAGLPYIVVLTNPTTGGVTASFAMLGDVTLAEPGALIGFAGPRVIENTLRESLPEGFQKSEYLLEHGMIDGVVHRRDVRDRLIRLIGLLTERRPSAEVLALPDPAARAGAVAAAGGEPGESADAESGAAPRPADSEAGAGADG